MKHNLYVYVDSAGNRPVMEFIHGQQPKFRKKILSSLGRLSISFPERMQMPYVKAHHPARYDGFYELRVRQRYAVRILFYLTRGGDIILMAGYVKGRLSCRQAELELARAKGIALAGLPTQQHSVYNLLR